VCIRSQSLPLPTRVLPSLTATIASSSKSRLPANIRLHTLPASRPSAYDEKHRGSHSRGSISSDSGSEFSLWSDTGDLVDQFADQEDPLRAKASHYLNDSNDHHQSHSRAQRTAKKVRYQPETEYHYSKESREHAPLRKEDIPIPNPPRKPIGPGEKIVAFIMAPNDAPSRMHGLHGKKLLYFTSVFVSLGVFLFGYDQGVMSGIITGPYFKNYFNQPSRAEIGTMVAILEVGALIASLSVGRLGDVLGRRKTILFGALIFLVGGALQTFANGMPMMLLGRIIAGLGVGALSTIVPIYQSEISPPHNRGKLACIEFTGNIVGYAASVWVDYFCSFIENDWAWRVPLLMQCVMGGLLAVGSLVICESPRYVILFTHVLPLLILILLDGFWTMTTTKRELLLSLTCTARVIFTTPRRAMSTERSR